MMFAGIFSNKKSNPTVTELFIRGRKNISHVFILFSCAKNIRLNSTHYFIKKIPNKREF